MSYKELDELAKEQAEQQEAYEAWVLLMQAKARNEQALFNEINKLFDF